MQQVLVSPLLLFLQLLKEHIKSQEVGLELNAGGTLAGRLRRALGARPLLAALDGRLQSGLHGGRRGHEVAQDGGVLGPQPHELLQGPGVQRARRASSRRQRVLIQQEGDEDGQQHRDQLGA